MICYKGNDHIFEEMEGLKFKINAKSFYQTNSDQAFELYKITRDFAGLTGDELRLRFIYRHRNYCSICGKTSQ